MFGRKKRKKLLATTAPKLQDTRDPEIQMAYCRAAAKHCTNQAKRLLRRAHLSWFRLIDWGWKAHMLKLSREFRELASGDRELVRRWAAVADRQALLDGWELERALREDARG